ncbi:MAG: hypothetical protein IKT46_01400 [Clostridia bacterium]|nr:hypothetical protein [Clostridia bacterium]
MILDSKETTVAYRCPHCGAGVMSVVGIFALSGDMIKLKCSCGKSELMLQYSKDKSVRITAPCIICPKPHNYSVSTGVFFSNELFRLGCTYTGLDICFIGSKDAVLEALKENESMLLGMFEEAGVTSLDALHKEDRFDDADDPFVEDVIRFMLAELKEEGSIHCKCGEGELPKYTFEFVAPDYEDIRIICETCGGSVTIPMTSAVNAEAFLGLDELYLK